MNNEIISVIKKILIEFTKNHNEYAGKVLEIINHLNEATVIAQSLPADIQIELRNIILGALAAYGIIIPQAQ